MIVTRVLALIFFLFGIALIVRASRAPRWAAARYLRASAGAMAAAIGNLFILRSPVIGLVFMLLGVWLIMSVGRSGAR